MKSLIRICRVFVLVFALVIVCIPTYAAMNTNQVYSGSGAIRSMTALANGTIIGGRSSGHEIEVWSSGNKGASWNRIGTVASNNNIDYGDIMFMAVPGTNTVYCAFRERAIANNTYSIVVCRSDNGGAGWVWDSTVIAGQTKFVGAPWLFIANNGDMQCYYDSEPLASSNGAYNSQWIAMQGRNGLRGEWNKYGIVAASRDTNALKFVRDGMASVVDLGNNRIMLVTEGIEDTPSGGVCANVIRAVQSFDGGVTWDYAGRRIVYQCGIDGGTGRRYNAYCPVAVRVGGGPVGVVFCTDEDFGGTPDMSNADVLQRRAHIKYIKTMNNFETWGELTSVWTSGHQAYAPGVVETASNELLITVDHFYGRQSFYKMSESTSATLDGVYYLRNANSGKYLDVAGASASDGANIHQWSFNGGENQKFKLVSDGNGNYSILTGISGYSKAVDVDSWGTHNGANILQWSYHGGDCQKFSLEKIGDAYVIKTKVSGNVRCLDVDAWSHNDGANVAQWDVHGGACQLWYLEKAN